ncbi:MAG: glycosyltransferase [Methanosarcina barkeri]|nr:glycosyltransferase [Methanosarcina sp. ERenArc_MAG2]
MNTYAYCNPLPKLSLLGEISKWVLDNCDTITVTGNYSKKFLNSIGVNESKIFVLPHVIDERFKSKSVSKEYDLIYVGRLAPVKHVETLIKSVELIKKEFPSIKVAIVGDGECKTKLEALTKKLGLDNNINFIGYQSNVWDWYNKGKVAVLTSEREGFPYSVVEALSCGLPVITSRCGDVSDVIKDGYNGIIVDSYQNHSSFTKAALELLQDSQMIEKYALNALKTSQYISTRSVVIAWKEILLGPMNK